MPFVEGKTIRGWAVVSVDEQPWEFKGIFTKRNDAEELAARLGSDFRVVFGENQEGTDNFVFAS